LIFLSVMIFNLSQMLDVIEFFDVLYYSMLTYEISHTWIKIDLLISFLNKYKLEMSSKVSLCFGIQLNFYKTQILMDDV
jgi:hypothetical protein